MEQGDGIMGTRLLDIVMDRNEDFLYEDSRAMKLTPYVMAERCLQAEFTGIMEEYKEGDYSVLTSMLGDGFKGYNNMDPSELIEEYKQIEDKWYELYESGSLPFSPVEDDPINHMETVI